MPKQSKIKPRQPAAHAAIKNRTFAILMVLAFVTRFFNFNYPPGIVFDEVHFGKFVRAYETGKNYFDIHPPLGKLLIFGFGKLGGVTLGQEFDQIGQKYDPHDLFVLRLLPTLMSALFVGIIYIFTLLLTESPLAAGIAGTLVLFDNGIMAQSRFILLDIFLLSFAFLSYIFFLLSERAGNLSPHPEPRLPDGQAVEGSQRSFWRTSLKFLRLARNENRQILFLLLTGIFFGASFSIKWTGLASIIVIGLLALRGTSRLRDFPRLFSKIIIIVVTAAVVYCGVFWIHFSLLDKPGPGDAFLSPDFHQKTFFEQIQELNKEMYHANERLRVEHPFASKWSQWPLDQKAIFFWQDDSLTATQGDLAIRREIWLFGNPVVWLFALLAVGAGTLLLVLALITRTFRDAPAFMLFLLLSAWAANVLPFSRIDRPLFIYHYFFPLVFSIILSGILCDYFLKKYALVHKKTGRRILCVGLVLVATSFLLIAPFTYGLQFSPLGMGQRTRQFFIENGDIGVLLFPKFVWEKVL